MPSTLCILTSFSGVMFVVLYFWAWAFGWVNGSSPGVDIATQQLFNSPGTNYPTDFTRDIVPVFAFVADVLTLLERNSFA